MSDALASARPLFVGSTGEVVADVMIFVALFIMFVVLPFLGRLDGRSWDRHYAEREREREVWDWLTVDDLQWFADHGVRDPRPEKRVSDDEWSAEWL